jgi:Class II Aldolase and Adducin N-terminal domain
VPFWDSRDEFGDTNLLVRTPEEGASHARALGPHWMLLLRRHGASLAGKSVRECVFRSIYTTRNAELQLRAMAIGTLGPLSAGEAEKCGGHNLGSRGVERAWEYWVTRLQKAEAMWAAAGLPRMKGLAGVARPQTAGLPQAKAPARRAAPASRSKKASAKKKRRAAWGTSRLKGIVAREDSLLEGLGERQTRSAPLPLCGERNTPNALRQGHPSRERDRYAPNRATKHNRCGEKPDCRQKRFLPPRLAIGETRCRRSGHIRCSIGRTDNGAVSTIGKRSRPRARRRLRRRSAAGR